MLVQCNSCGAIFEHNSEYDDICPNCMELTFLNIQ